MVVAVLRSMPMATPMAAGDADGRGSADDHVADDGGDLLVVGGEDVGLLEGELGLVEEVNACGEPFEGGNHVFLSLSCC